VLELNAAIGDSPANTHMGFRVLDADKSAALLAVLPLASDRHEPQPTEREYVAASVLLSGELDRQVSASRRTEQAYLRRALFPEPDGVCNLCGALWPREFLIAAHIKKRAACDDDERRDVPSCVMAACVFGCDQLFERGYISVADDGALLLSSTMTPGSAVSAWASRTYAGRAFAGQLQGRQRYFEWHRTHSFRG
jgi:predicted restriction endonuclease